MNRKWKIQNEERWDSCSFSNIITVVTSRRLRLAEDVDAINPLQPGGNYMSYLFQQSVNLTFCIYVSLGHKSQITSLQL
jgi:hypothetical protein